MNTSKVNQEKLQGLLDKAIQIASSAHENQMDKAGEPYILHPLRLMMQFQDENERITAVLHDVVEDSDVTIDQLSRQGFNEEIIDALERLTKKNGESYGNFIDRITSCSLARKIKIADIEDNLNITRLTKLSQTDLERIEKYHNALNTLKFSAFASER